MPLPIETELCALYPSLAGLPPATLTQLLAASTAIDLPAGTTVFAENMACQGFPLVLSGSIKVVKQAVNGREILLYRVAPAGSCIISSSCLLSHSNYNARGIAETPVSLRLVPVALFATILLNHAPFRDFVFHLFADRISELMQLVEEVAFARLDQRLAKLLLARGDNNLQVTHQQLADELGSVREIVSRLLKGFAAQGLVTLSRERIELTDRAALEKLATAL